MNLQKCDIFELKTLKEPIDYVTLANNPETLEKVEGCMKVWIKQTEQVISRSQISVAMLLNWPVDQGISFAIRICLRILPGVPER